MLRFLFLLLSIFNTLVFTNLSHATLIKIPDPMFSYAVFDDATNLIWAPMPAESPTFNYNSVLDRTSPGGMWYGYNLATIDQVKRLISNGGLPLTALYPSWVMLDLPVVLNFLDLFPATFSSSREERITHGICLSEDDPNAYMIPSFLLSYFIYPDRAEFFYTDNYPLRRDYSPLDDPIGAWLVRPVPEPTTGLLLGVAVLIFGLRRRLQG